MRARWRAALTRSATRRPAGTQLLGTFADKYPDAFFIEVGANDGEQGDPLREFVLSRRWRGIMVEPLPHVFERLSANYRGLGRVVLENAAIADSDGRRPFYYVAPLDPESGLEDPEWHDAIGSFSRETLLRSADLVPDLERRIVRTEVPCLSFDSLCRKHSVEDLDLVLVDAEGYDHEIVRGRPGAAPSEAADLRALPAFTRAARRVPRARRAIGLLDDGGGLRHLVPRRSARRRGDTHVAPAAPRSSRTVDD
jgi:FkbM family methyltransferase